MGEEEGGQLSVLWCFDRLSSPPGVLPAVQPCEVTPYFVDSPTSPQSVLCVYVHSFPMRKKRGGEETRVCKISVCQSAASIEAGMM